MPPHPLAPRWTCVGCDGWVMGTRREHDEPLCQTCQRLGVQRSIEFQAQIGATLARREGRIH
jgi:hypothetical protein